MSFSFIDDKNKILDIDSSQNYYLAGKNKEILFISKTFNISDGIITFDVDTYTEPFLNEIKKRNTEIQIELGYNTSGIQKVLLRDYAFAQPRVYIEGLNPSKVDLTDYYTKGEVDELIKDVDVPTKVSELENDVGYITGYTEADPIFSATSGQFELKSEAFDGDYNSLTNKPVIPTKISELQNDSGFISNYTETDPIFSATSGQFELKSEAFDGDYNSLTNKPVIPTKISELQNDSGFISNYTETDPIFTSISGTLATKNYVNEAIPDISDMLNVEGSILNVGGVSGEGIPKYGNVEINGVIVATHGTGLIVNDFANKEILSVFEHNLKYKNEYDIERMKRVNATDFNFESYAYLTLTSPITSINYNLPEGTLKNAILQFTTGENITFTITGSAAYKINKPFNFEASTTYIIYVDAYDIFWCKLHNFNQ